MGVVFVDIFLEWVLNQIGAKSRRARYAGRPASASTAVGQMLLHVAKSNNFLRTHWDSGKRTDDSYHRSQLVSIRSPPPPVCPARTRA